VAFALATVRALLQHRSPRVRLTIDGQLVLDEAVVLVAAANGRHFGGGMRVAPEARLDDGWLDVVWIAHTPTWKLLVKLPKLYRGTHLTDPVVRWRRGRRIEADAEPGVVPLELDGEPLGTLPASLELLPAALAIVGPKA
jgi:diacylglycerol kinase family enzyme